MGFWKLLQCEGSREGVLTCTVVPPTLVCRLALLAMALRGTGLVGVFWERPQGQTGVQDREALSLSLALLGARRGGSAWGLASKAGRATFPQIQLQLEVGNGGNPSRL